MMGIFKKLRHSEIFDKAVRRDSLYIYNLCCENRELVSVVNNDDRMMFNIYFSVCHYYGKQLSDIGLSDKDIKHIIMINLEYLCDSLGIPYSTRDNPLYNMYCLERDQQDDDEKRVRAEMNDESFVFAKLTLLCLVPPVFDDLFFENELQEITEKIMQYHRDVMSKTEI